MNCELCTEKYDFSKRKKITCYKCEYAACRSCTQNYFLSKQEEAHCMNCRVQYNIDFMIQNFTKTFLNRDYSWHLGNILFNRENALMPSTIPHVENEQKLEMYKEKEANIRERIKELKNELIGIKDIINTLHENKVYGIAYDSINNTKCPVTNCNGYLNEGYICITCNTAICNNCHEVKSNLHICDKNTIKTVNMIKSNSKPCPNCSFPITKLEGCDHMFCIKCDTSFDWNTMQVQNSHAGNPEYYDKLNRVGNIIPRNALDVICGRELDSNFSNELRVKLLNARNVDYDTLHMYETMFSNIQYLQSNVERLFPITNTIDLRVKYMRNKISQELFIQKLRKQNKKNKIHYSLREIMVTFVHSMIELFYRLVDDIYKHESIKDEMDELRGITNCEIYKTYRKYDYSSKLYINSEFKVSY